jgi:hypothetical protein
MNRSSLTRSRRQSASLLAAAVASVASAGITSSPAQGGLFIDLRLAGINNVDVGPANRKAIPPLNIGDTLTFNLVVRVTGTNSAQTVGNFDNSAPATDTRNDDAIAVLVGAFASFGTIKGDFQGGANSNQGAGNQLTVWSAPGSTNGVAQDFDSDGDLDLGALGTDPTNMWVARAASPQIPTVGKRTAIPQTRFGVTNMGASGAGAAFMEDTGGPNTAVPGTNVIDATSAETLLGEVTWIATGGSGSTLAFNFIPRSNAEAAALWFEDGIATGKNGTNSSMVVGAPVTLFIPEPATMSLLGLASLGLLARMRKKSIT